MDADPTPNGGDDSLDRVELVMAVEEALSKSVPGERRERLRRDIAERIAKGDFGDEDLDDPIGSVVRNPGPRDPRGEAGAAAVPEEPLSE